jgi:hypothetical protein
MLREFVAEHVSRVENWIEHPEVPFNDQLCDSIDIDIESPDYVWRRVVVEENGEPLLKLVDSDYERNHEELECVYAVSDNQVAMIL